MVTVSENSKSLYYVLDKNLNGEKILADIQKLINKSHNLSQSILKISISSITTSTNDMIKKLEYKP
jgi:hypothetical protein